MNYRHAYHAGGPADIVKHIILTHIVRRMGDKPTPFCVFDIFAGAGGYDLHSDFAAKTNESREGVFPFIKLRESAALAPLQSILKHYNPGLAFGSEDAANLKTYPGSPAMILQHLREGDRLIAVEKHPEDSEKLRRFFRDEKRVQVHARDAAEALHALVPPPEKRLFIFADPPYERADELEMALKALIEAHARARHAVIALWYPVKDPIAVNMLHEKFLGADFEKILRIEVPFYEDILPDRLNGSGMLLFNPPWKIEEEIGAALKELRPLFAVKAPLPVIEWLKR